MTILLYIMAAYGTFNLLVALGWWLNSLRKRRRCRAPTLAEADVGYQEHEGDPMFPGTDPNTADSMESYLDVQPAGMHAGQKSAREDSDDDAFTKTIDAIALRLHEDLEKANPKPPEPKVKAGEPLEPWLKWMGECNRIDAMIESAVLTRMRDLDLRSEEDASAAFRELEAGMKDA